MAELVLASQSPRRKELLDLLGVPFHVMPSGADESLSPGLALAPALEEVALRKAAEVAPRAGRSAFVLAADTAVVLDGRSLGKPLDRADAEVILAALSGRTHSVITAVALLGPGLSRQFSVETEVTFRRLSATQIAWYAADPEPYDKAGAYAIQGRGAFLVASIRGSYTNVVGLPMTETAELLEEIGLAPWSRGGVQ